MRNKRAKRGKFDTQPQLTRLHGLVKRIQRGDYPTQDMLATEWEKSPRTIQSDLDFIRDVWKMPLGYDRARFGYYFSESVANFPMVPISEQELVSVFIAQKALQQYHGTPFEAPLRSAFSKLVSSLEGDLSVAWADLDTAISFRGIETDPKDMEMLGQLGEAIRKRREIIFRYHKLERAEEAAERSKKNDKRKHAAPLARTVTGERRRVRPYHLACVGGQWYLFAYDLMRRDMRKFVPARMRHLRVTTRRFERPRDFSIDNLLKGSFGVFSGNQVVPIRIWFGRARAQLMRERKWHHSQAIKELGNGEIELQMELSSFAEIVPWILSWGEHARALEPGALVKEVKDAAKRVVRSYR
jgi:proteasome accessory factor B